LSTKVERFKSVFDLLRNALSISKYASFRQRFASIEQWHEEGPTLHAQAYICWLNAKSYIGEDRAEFERYIESIDSDLCQDDIDNFKAALKVIDKELEKEFEQQILKGDDNGNEES
jgi:hypothetical protein